MNQKSNGQNPDPLSPVAAALRNVRSAALAASLVPVALVAAQPAALHAQTCDPSAGCSVPEPSTLLLMAPAAALAWRQRHRLKK